MMFPILFETTNPSWVKLHEFIEADNPLKEADDFEKNPADNGPLHELGASSPLT
jgi:hypothetical protein